jgi:hypothetical protein
LRNEPLSAADGGNIRQTAPAQLSGIAPAERGNSGEPSEAASIIVRDAILELGRHARRRGFESRPVLPDFGRHALR